MHNARRVAFVTDYADKMINRRWRSRALINSLSASTVINYALNGRTPALGGMFGSSTSITTTPPPRWKNRSPDETKKLIHLEIPRDSGWTRESRNRPIIKFRRSSRVRRNQDVQDRGIRPPRVHPISRWQRTMIYNATCKAAGAVTHKPDNTIVRVRSETRGRKLQVVISESGQPNG